MRGFQLRYVSLVSGSLLVLLVFAGFHGASIAQSSLSAEAMALFRPVLQESTWRLFMVGILYIAVVTLSAIFLSHRAVGPVHRLEEDIRKFVDAPKDAHPLKVREGDELAGLTDAINKLIERVK